MSTDDDASVEQTENASTQLVRPQMAMSITKSQPYFFSIGALLGSVFVGLWIAATAILAVREVALRGPGLDHVATLGSAGFMGLLIAVVAAVPATLAVAVVMGPLAIFAKGRLRPTRPNVALVGACFGALIGACLSYGYIAEGWFAPVLLIVGAGSGALAGTSYRSLLLFKYPHCQDAAQKEIGRGGASR